MSMNTCMNGMGFIMAFVGQQYESFDTKVEFSLQGENVEGAALDS